MKKKEKTSLKTMSAAELGKVLVDAKTALAIRQLADRYTKQSKNVHEAGALRRKIAVVSTLLRQKEIVHE